MKISVTMLSSYLYCPRKLFLQKVLAVEEPPKESIVLGSLRHEIYDFINQAEEKIVSSVGKGIQYAQLITLYKNFYSRALRERIIKNKSKIKNSQVLFILAGQKEKTLSILGDLRLYLGQQLNLIDENKDGFLWVVDFPMLEYDENEKRYVARHHPFTSPHPEDILLLD